MVRPGKPHRIGVILAHFGCIYLMPGTVTMLLEMSGKATAVAGLKGLVPFKSSCLKSCSRMGSIFFGIVTSLPTARACN